MYRTRRVFMAVLLFAAIPLTGCSAPQQSPIVVPMPSFVASSASSPAVARIAGSLPSGCGAVATADEVSDAIGRTLSGEPRLVNGAPDPAIGRTARLDCYYGLADGQPNAQAPVAVGLAVYNDVQAANRRVTTTVSAEREAGAKVSDVQVGQDAGILTTGRKATTLIAVHEATTVVVTAPLDVVPADRAPQVLARIADRALSPR